MMLPVELLIVGEKIKDDDSEQVDFLDTTFTVFCT